MTAPSVGELRALSAIALFAAREAAAHVASGWRKHPVAEHKGRVDLVTRFDRESEEILRARLAREAPFAFVGEEGARAGDASAGPVWYVDPLDGTTNFVHGHPFYCVSVGLALGGAPLAGAVVAPSLGLDWVGVAGDSASRSGEACRVSATSTFAEAYLATGFPYDRTLDPDNNYREFTVIEMKCLAVRRCGAAAIDLCLVADGTYDGYWEQKVQAWDVAAGAAIVLGAGGRISAYDGSAADVTSRRIVATNGRVHDALVAEIAAARRFA